MSLYANHSSSENSRWKFLFLLSSRSEIYEREHTDCARPEVDITLSKQRRAANDETVSPRGQSAGAPHSWYVTVYTPPSFFTDFQFHGSFSPAISLILEPWWSSLSTGGLENVSLVSLATRCKNFVSTSGPVKVSTTNKYVD